MGYSTQHWSGPGLRLQEHVTVDYSDTLTPCILLIAANKGQHKLKVHIIIMLQNSRYAVLAR